MYHLSLLFPNNISVASEHQSSHICTLSLSCLFLLRLWTEASLDCLSLAALLLRSGGRTSVIILSQLLWLLPMVSWGCHNSNHAVSFLGQRLSTINVSWWLGCIQGRGCFTSTICTWCAVCGCQMPGSLQSVLLLWTRPLPVLPVQGRHELSRRESCVFSFMLTHLCAKLPTSFSKCSSYYSVIKCFAHPTCTGEEGPISLRWQAWMGDNVIHSQ